MTGPYREPDPPPVPPPVIIVWVEEWPVERLQTIAYHSGKGHVRVYPRDGYDARLRFGPPLPYFDNALDAGEYLSSEARREFEAADAACRLGGKPAGVNPFPGICQVDVRAALELGYDLRELDPLALRKLAPGLLSGRGRRR